MPDLDTLQAKSLYDAVSAEFDIGTYDDYLAKMQTEQDRKSFFDAVSAEFDIGKYDEFETKLKKKDDTTPVSKSLEQPSESTAKDNKLEELAKQHGYTLEKLDQLASLSDADFDKAVNVPGVDTTKAKLLRKEYLAEKEKAIYEKEPVSGGGILEPFKITEEKPIFKTPSFSELSSKYSAEQEKADVKIPFTEEEIQSKKDEISTVDTIINAAYQNAETNPVKSNAMLASVANSETIDEKTKEYYKPYIYELSGNNYIRQDNFTEAEKAYKTAYKLNPSQKNAINISYSANKNKNYVDADIYADKALSKININNIDESKEALRMKGLTLVNLGKEGEEIRKMLDPYATKIKGAIEEKQDIAYFNTIQSFVTPKKLTKQEWHDGYDLISNSIIGAPLLGAAESVGKAITGIGMMTTDPPKDKVYTKEEYADLKEKQVRSGFMKTISGTMSAMFNMYPSIYAFNVALGGIGAIEKATKDNPLAGSLLTTIPTALKETGIIDKDINITESISSAIFAPISTVLEKTGVLENLSDEQKDAVEIADVATVILLLPVAGKVVGKTMKYAKEKAGTVGESVAEYIKTEDVSDYYKSELEKAGGKLNEKVKVVEKIKKGETPTESEVQELADAVEEAAKSEEVKKFVDEIKPPEVKEQAPPVSEVKPEVTGKKITPAPEVITEPIEAIKEIAEQGKYENVSLGDGSLLFKSFKEKDISESYKDEKGEITSEGIVEINKYDKNGNLSIRGRALDRLSKDGYLEEFDDGTYGLTSTGKEFIDSVNARIETRKGVKDGTDLFPEDANIPELKTIKEELKTQTDGNTINKYEQRTADEIEKSESVVEALETKEETATEKGSIEQLESEIDTEINNIVTKPEKSITESGKEIAASIREAKIGDDITLATIPFAKEIINGSIEVVALAVEGGAKLADAVQKGVDWLKEQDFYKKLSETDKGLAEEKLKNFLDEKVVKLKKETQIPGEGERQKGFLDSVVEKGEADVKTKQQTSELDQFYKQKTNKEAITKADKEITSDVNKVKEEVLSDSPPSAEKSVKAVRLIKYYENLGDYDSAIEIINSYDQQLRAAGQFVQAASIWGKANPLTILKAAEKKAKQLGKKYEKRFAEQKDALQKRLIEIDKLPEGEEKTKATLEVLNTIAELFPPKLREYLDAYRYTNMLSNPRSHERNIWGNLMNTFLTRPLQLTATATYDLFKHPLNKQARTYKFSDVPTYLKSAALNLPNAITAFKEAMKNGTVSDKILDTGRSVDAIEAIRQKKMPKALTFVTRFLESQDRFFSTLIAEGEKSRLLKNGETLENATLNSQLLAEKYLYREKLGSKGKDQPLLVRALDNLGKSISEMRNKKYFGEVFGWFVPFVKTPVNIAKMGVEFSPLGFIGGKYGKEQIGAATVGSLVSGVGAILAMNDKTTWSPPRDPEEKELFYSSGRKPYSVQIGDKWIPLSYFGPFGLSLALPAALKHYNEDTPTSMTDSDIENVSEAILSTGKFITSQTPLQGLESFFKVLEGDSDIKSPQAAGFMTGQFIPLSGLVKCTNQYIDPIYRKSKTKDWWEGYIQTIEKDLPGLSENVKPITDPKDRPVERDPVITMLPYDVGITDKEYDQLLKIRRETLKEKNKEKVSEEEQKDIFREKFPKATEDEIDVLIRNWNKGIKSKVSQDKKITEDIKQKGDIDILLKYKQDIN
jgi:hypothetical protein